MSFVRYNTEDSVVSSETVVRGLWSGDLNEITTFFTGSTNTGSYVDVYKDDPNVNTSASVQFSIQYGHVSGSGSTAFNSGVAYNTPTRVVYGQYRNLIYGSEDNVFTFGSIVSENIFVINVNRARYKESLKPGSFNIKLTSGSNSLVLTDNSNDVTTTSFIDSNRYYTIVSGSNGNATAAAISNPSGSYGLYFPDMGIIVFNSRALQQSAVNGGLGLITGSANNAMLFTTIIKTGATFKLQSQETISSRFFFTRVKNGEFNYTTNPSVIDSQGNLLYTTLVDNPQTYITTVGLYNDNNELLAVAKLSRPLVKDFVKETLLRVKLEY